MSKAEESAKSANNSIIAMFTEVEEAMFDEEEKESVRVVKRCTELDLIKRKEGERKRGVG